MITLANKTAALAATVLLAMSGIANADTMDEEIDHLLDTVGNSGCVFIRNGKRYEAPAAQKHLQTKRKLGKRYYKNADEFIANLASESSMSGDPYFIQCGDDAQQLSGDWFAAVLAKYRDPGVD
jgi:hypothetical protein